MAWEENSRICLHMQLIAILSRIGVILAYHYIEFFGREGSSYWWCKYHKIHSDENEK